MMIAIQYWKVYFPYYGRECELSNTIMKAQADQFSVEGLGVPITPEMLQAAQQKNTQNVFPFLLANTTMQMYEEARFVQSLLSCTYGDLDRRNAGDVTPSNLFGSGYPSIASLRGNINSFTSDATKRLHAKVSESVASINSRPTRDDVQDARKNIISDVDNILKNPNITKKHIAQLEQAFSQVRVAITDDIFNEHGMDDGKSGDMEWAAETADIGPIEKRFKGAAG